MTEDEKEEAREAAFEQAAAYLKRVKELRKEMLDDVLTEDQLDYIADYLYDNIRVW